MNIDATALPFVLDENFHGFDGLPASTHFIAKNPECRH